jgi:hypothetical protein
MVLEVTAGDTGILACAYFRENFRKTTQSAAWYLARTLKPRRNPKNLCARFRDGALIDEGR